MANKNLFQTVRGLFTPPTDTINEAGGTAYKLSPKAALAQYAATGCFNQTFYTDAGEQLEKVIELTKECDAEFVAKVAIYAREKGFINDGEKCARNYSVINHRLRAGNKNPKRVGFTMQFD